MSTNEIPTRKLGKDGPRVSEIGFGLMGISAAYGKEKSDSEAFPLLDAALARGCTFWDTSDAYAGNEDMLGRYFAKTGNRDKVFLATKFAFAIDNAGNHVVRGDPEYVRTSLDKSLRSLGVTHIDLWYQHRVDKRVPIEITVRAMAEQVAAGKVRYLGLSECSAATLRRAHAVHPIAAVQIEYSPFTLEIENEDIGLLAACRELGVAVVAYSPLGRGMLTGAIRSRDAFEEGDFRLYSPRFSEENFHKNLELVDNIKAAGERKRCTPGQLTLAWLLAQGDDIILIPGTTRIANLVENLGAARVVLTKDEVAELRTTIEAAEVKGERAPAAFMSMNFADSPALPDGSM